MVIETKKQVYFTPVRFGVDLLACFQHWFKLIGYSFDLSGIKNPRFPC